MRLGSILVVALAVLLIAAAVQGFDFQSHINKSVNYAPMGIASYGIMEVDGRYLTYTLTTDAVMGVVRISDALVEAYGNWRSEGFSAWLNAIVVAILTDGTTQYYLAQSSLSYSWNECRRFTVYISNVTAPSPILDRYAVSGKGLVSGSVYSYTKWSPTRWYSSPCIKPEIRTYVEYGKIIVEFYLDGQMYDKVAITPYAPAISAYIKVAPTTTPAGYPLVLELVLGGYNGNPWAVLRRGQIGLELYVRMNDKWVPPPSAWSVGYATYGGFRASAVPQGVGSVILTRGSPNPRQLWAGTIIATYFGFNATNSTNLSPYARSPIYLDDDIRVILTGAYVNGRPAQLSSLSNVPLGSIVVLQYKPQYFISISVLGNRTAGWFNGSSTIVINGPPVVDFGNGTRLAKPTLKGVPLPVTYTVTGPADLSVSYVKQYLVSLTSPINNTAVWANASSAVVLRLPPVVDFGNGTRLVEPRINGTRPPLIVKVNRPMSFVGTYFSKQYLVTYSGPTWLNRTWINASALLVFNPPQIINLGNGTRLVNPLINGTRPPLSITVDKPLSLSVEYTRQYLVSIRTPFRSFSDWANASASYTPPTISRSGIKLVPQESVVVNAPMNIDVHYNAYAEVPTTFAGLPALYAEASITCGGASNSTSGFFVSSLKLELIDAPSDKCSVSVNESVPSLALVAVAIIVVLAIILIRRRPSKT